MFAQGMFSLGPSMILRRSLQIRGYWRSLATHSQANVRIPVVDFSKFLNASSPSEKSGTADEIVGAFKDSGFVYLSNHGIPESTVSNVFEKSAQFFRMPQSVKDKLAWEDPRSNRGYVKIGREKVTQSSDADKIVALRTTAPDYKETIEIGRDWDSTWKNRWPEERDVPGFKQTMLAFYQTCHQLHAGIMRSIALGIGLDEFFFDDKINDQCHNLRLLSYPPVNRALLQGDDQARAGAHSDYGSITLLFQDSVGGLQVQNPHTGDFQAALPIPGTIVVNAADLLARWSNDVLRSTLHRVVAPPSKAPNGTQDVVPARQSIAFFCNPNFDARITCLPSCYGPGRPRKYEAITTEEYIVQRLSETIY